MARIIKHIRRVIKNLLDPIGITGTWDLPYCPRGYSPAPPGWTTTNVRDRTVSRIARHWNQPPDAVFVEAEHVAEVRGFAVPLRALEDFHGGGILARGGRRYVDD
jgi:hypothetical protein